MSTTAPGENPASPRSTRRCQCDGAPLANGWRAAAARWTSPGGTTTWSFGTRRVSAHRPTCSHRAALFMQTAPRHRGRPPVSIGGHRSNPTPRTKERAPAPRSQTVPTHLRTKLSENSDFLTHRTHQRFVLARYLIKNPCKHHGHKIQMSMYSFFPRIFPVLGRSCFSWGRVCI